MKLLTVEGCWDVCWEGLSYLKGAGHWEYDNAPMSIQATQMDLVNYFLILLGFFWGGRAQSGVSGNEKQV